MHQNKPAVHHNDERHNVQIRNISTRRWRDVRAIAASRGLRLWAALDEMMDLYIHHQSRNASIREELENRGAR